MSHLNTAFQLGASVAEAYVEKDAGLRTKMLVGGAAGAGVGAVTGGEGHQFGGEHRLRNALIGGGFGAAGGAIHHVFQRARAQAVEDFVRGMAQSRTPSAESVIKPVATATSHASAVETPGVVAMADLVKRMAAREAEMARLQKILGGGPVERSIQDKWNERAMAPDYETLANWMAGKGG
jgi:hypothetical protein